MRNKITLLRALFLIIGMTCFALSGFSQGQNTTQGKDFWVSVGSNVKTPTIQIRIVATKNSTVTFTFAELGTSYSFAVTAGQVYTRELTSAEATAVFSNASGVSSKSLRVQSSEPVSVFAINLAANTTDATNVLPATNLGMSYYHLSYQSMSGIGDGYTIVAVENNTQVYENGVLKTTLNSGQVYSQYYVSQDLTGRNITSSKPIAYYTTNSCVNIPKGIAACDCLYQQMVPVHSWGNNFLVPVTKRGVERVRIVASQAGTVITQTGGTVITSESVGKGSLNLNAGEFVELEVTLASKGCYISSNKPVAVASYLTGTLYTKLTYAEGDPAFAWVPPIEQLVNTVAIAPFIASGSSVLKEHHALIVAKTATKDQTTMSIGSGNATALSGGSWTDHSSGYSFYSLPLTSESSTYFFDNPNGLTVNGYGLGSAESYYYLAASSARKLDAAFYINEIHFEDVNGQTYCDKDYKFRAVIQYAMSNSPGYLRWYINDVEETSAVDQKEWSKQLAPGTYKIEMKVIDMFGDLNTLTTHFTVITDPVPPVITPSGSVSFCAPENGINLTATGGGSVYQWYLNGNVIPGAIKDAYYASVPGSYTVRSSFGSCSTPFSDPVIVAHGSPAKADLIAVSGASTCSGGSVSLKAVAPEVNNPIFRWYESQTATMPVFMGDIFPTPALIGTTTYYVSVSGSNFCENAINTRKPVTVTIANTLVAGTISGVPGTCSIVSSDIKGTLPSGGTGPYTYEWEQSANGVDWTIIPYATAQHYLPGKLSNSTYFRRITIDPQCGRAISNVHYIALVPDEMYWSTTTANSNWNDAANWLDVNGNHLNCIPLLCTNVHIPGNAAHYPSLDFNNTLRNEFLREPECNNITYHFGGEVAKPHFLTYNKAFVRYDFGYYNASNVYTTGGDKFSASPMARGCWYALAAPLKKMVSGDFSFGGYPNTWQQGFRTAPEHTGDITGEWYAPENTNALEIGAKQNYGISVWVGEYLPGVLGEEDQALLNGLKGIIEMPFFENPAVSTQHRIHSYDGTTSKFSYYRYQDPGMSLVPAEEKAPGSIARGSEAYRFIFEDSKNKAQETFTMTVPAGEDIMIGNPYLSSLDFPAFYQANSGKMEEYYRLYDNGVFQSYSISAQTATSIAPMQAFFIKTKGTKGQTIQLTFSSNNMSIARSSVHQLKTGNNSGPHILRVLASNEKGKSSVDVVLNQEAGSVNVPQLFVNDITGKQAPQLYSMDAGNMKTSVYFVPGSDVEIPLGIRSESKGQMELSFIGLDNINAGSVLLIDKSRGNKQIDLLENKYKPYSFTYDSSDPDRFILKLGRIYAPTGIDELENNQVRIFVADNILYAESEKEISELILTSVQGSKIFVETPSVTRYSKKLSLNAGVYFVTVKLPEGETRTEKVIVQ